MSTIAMQLREAITKRDAIRTFGLLDGLTPLDRAPDVEGLVADLMRNTSDKALRNASAIALADLRATGRAQAIRDLLRDAYKRGEGNAALCAGRARRRR